MIDFYILPQQIRISEILARVRNSYLTHVIEAVTCCLYIACIGSRAYGSDVIVMSGISLLCHSDVIMLYLISAYSGTSGSLF